MAIFFCKLQNVTLLLIQGYSVSGVAFTIGVKKKNCFHAVLLIWLDPLLWMCNRQLWAWGLEGFAGSDTSFFRSFEAHLWVHVLFLALLSLKTRAGGLATLFLETVWVAKVLLWLMHSLAHMCPLYHPSLMYQTLYCEEGWFLLSLLQEHFLFCDRSEPRTPS